jgi:hypothetical protein
MGIKTIHGIWRKVRATTTNGSCYGAVTSVLNSVFGGPFGDISGHLLYLGVTARANWILYDSMMYLG